MAAMLRILFVVVPCLAALAQCTSPEGKPTASFEKQYTYRNAALNKQGTIVYTSTVPWQTVNRLQNTNRHEPTFAFGYYSDALVSDQYAFQVGIGNTSPRTWELVWSGDATPFTSTRRVEAHANGTVPCPGNPTRQCYASPGDPGYRPRPALPSGSLHSLELAVVCDGVQQPFDAPCTQVPAEIVTISPRWSTPPKHGETFLWTIGRSTGLTGIGEIAWEDFSNIQTVYVSQDECKSSTSAADNLTYRRMSGRGPSDPFLTGEVIRMTWRYSGCAKVEVFGAGPTVSKETLDFRTRDAIEIIQEYRVGYKDEEACLKEERSYLLSPIVSLTNGMGQKWVAPYVLNCIK